MVRFKTRIGAAALAGIGALALVLSACSSSDSSGGEKGPAAPAETGVAFGASKEEWQAAFADVDAVEIRTQSSGAKGAASTMDWENFLAAITEYSDGKITFDVGYANGYAPPLESIDALSDGRLDLAQVIPQYFPADLPVSAALVNSAIISNASPVYGTISSNVWPLEAGFASEQVAEFEDAGMKLLIPYYNTGAGALICADDHSSASDLKGVVVAASGAYQSKQVEAIGASPTSMPFTEFYESLQRGAVGCAQTTGNAAMVAGLPEVAPHVIIDPEASFIPGAATVAFSDAAWQELDDLVKQLIWERSGDFVAGNITNVIGGYQRLNDAVSAQGGSIHEFDADVRAKLEDVRGTLLDEVAAATSDEFVDNAKSSADKWQQKVKDAGFDVDVDYSGLQEWLDDGNADAIREFVADTVYAEIYEPLRP